MDYVQKKLAIPIPTINVIWVLFWEEGGGGVLGPTWFFFGENTRHFDHFHELIMRAPKPVKKTGYVQELNFANHLRSASCFTFPWEVGVELNESICGTLTLEGEK